MKTKFIMEKKLWNRPVQMRAAGLGFFKSDGFVLAGNTARPNNYLLSSGPGNDNFDLM